MLPLEKKLRIRNTLVKVIENYLREEIKPCYEHYQEEKLTLLQTLNTTIESKLGKFLSITEEISEIIEEEDQLIKDAQESSDFEVRVRNELLILDRFLKSKQDRSDTVSTRSVSASSSIKLPKIEIKKFDGDPTNWFSFIDSFEAAVDKNDHLSNVEKMNYLLGFVVKDAASTISGLKLSNDNYEIALNLLKDRFGDPQMIISGHMNKLLNLEPVMAISDVRNLRQLFYITEAQVRSLQSLGVESQNFGSMLIPVLLQKLPGELRLIISRQLGKNAWKVSEVMQAFKTELEAREKVSTGQEESPCFSGASLYVGNRRNFDAKERKCAFCENPGHKPQFCSIVSKPTARSSILKRKGLCFLCLQSGHVARHCTVRWKCFKCKGRHHVSICNKGNRDQDSNDQNEGEGTSNNVANTECDFNAVLLQTASAEIFSDDKNCHRFRILFDSGSQMSYISPQAAEKLKLKTIDKKQMCLKTFGGAKQNKTLDMVRFTVKTKNDEENITVNAFVSEICYPLTNQNIEGAKSNYPFLCRLDLADSNPKNQPLSVDILIGGDYYWSFMKNDMKRSTKGGPTAISSKLGYILSGGVMGTKLDTSVNIVNTHVLKVQNELSENKTLEDLVQGFWNIETMGIKKSEENEISDHGIEAGVTFKKDRYEVKLPIKDHDLLEDNYDLSKQRLKNMIKIFKNKSELLKQYDNIFREQESCQIIEKAPDEHVVGHTHFVPHKPVIREEKATTKVRMVFDGSAKKNGPSLNDCMEPGPFIATPLFDVLARFRVNNIAFIADIEKAFLKMSLFPGHRGYVRFLWFNNIDTIDFDNFEIQRNATY
ncbi:uncharacterized protein LOC130629417 [Hydractinia symbiolongicarpus]|uniref:uncharacterized protein LOC130629417 n=1 Tax=Hydractinia symbiolongicarpus TaxID=13093 RepID=UPI002551B093|nr:uncharacterized protein LOC130629417 [Hydractinia symbiolongicarpus]